MYGQTGPMAAQHIQQSNTIVQPNINLQNNTKDNGEFGTFESGQSKNENVVNLLIQVKWLSEKEKGLIDFSDLGSFSNSTKPQSTNSIYYDIQPIQTILKSILGIGD